MADGLFGGGGAAFGIYPQMGGRRTMQDPQASADIPADVLRGRIVGLLGAIPDLLNLKRSLLPAEAVQALESYGKIAPEVPYGSEYYLQNLPLPPTSQVGQVANQLGSFVPLNPAPIARAVGKVGNVALSELARGMYGNEGSLANVIPTAMKPMMAVEPSLSMPKPQAQVSELGFYSAAEQAALNLPRNKGTGQAFLNDLMKSPDVKKDELSWTGLDDFLANKPNVTKQEVQDFIANNRLNLQERVLSGRGEKSGVFSEFNPDKNQFIVYGNDLSLHGAFNTAEEADNFVKQFNSQIPYGPSKYDKYQLPGGENYREILLTLPFKEPVMPKGYQVTPMQYDDGTVKYFAETPTSRSQGFRTQEEAQEQLLKTANNLKGFRENLESYKSSHFDEPNILAHMRVNDRVDAEGKKMLLIEEVQSDWHQAGREKGYKTPQLESALKEYELLVIRNANGQKLTPQEMARVKELQPLVSGKSGGVPDAPFKDTWHQLALKRAIKEAVDKGYDRIGLTTGAQQAARYDLSKQVDYIDYKTSGYGDSAKYRLGIVDKNQQGIDLPKEYYSAKELPEIVGKEIAEKIIKGEGQSGGGRMTLRGVDLQVGGEGMKKYYDEIYPNYLNKLGKKYGAQVGETKVNTVKERAENSMIPTTKQEPVRYLDITPEMRKAVKEGQPLFTAIPAGTLGLGALDYSDPFGNTIGESIR